MNILHIYTDGACSGNPGPGGAAAVLTTESNLIIRKVSQGYKHSTNQRMELAAAILGLKTALAHAMDGFDGITIHSDSATVVGLMNQGWKAKANTDLADELKELAAQAAAYGPVSFVKVAGHAGDKYNEMADKLAVAACSSPCATVDRGYAASAAPKAPEAPATAPTQRYADTVVTTGGRHLTMDLFTYRGGTFALVLDQKQNPITIIKI